MTTQVAPLSTGTRARLQIAGRRTTLPNTRALVGAVLIVLAALGTFVAFENASHPPKTFYVVARGPLMAGHKITPNDIALAPMNLPDLVSNRAYQAATLVTGQRLNVSLQRGELIQSSMVANTGLSNGRQLVLSLDQQHAVGGTLVANERVDVVATTGTGVSAQTRILLYQAQVLAVEAQKQNIASGTTYLVSLAIPTEEDEIAVTNAADTGKITLVRTSG